VVWHNPASGSFGRPHARSAMEPLPTTAGRAARLGTRQMHLAQMCLVQAIVLEMVAAASLETLPSARAPSLLVSAVPALTAAPAATASGTASAIMPTASTDFSRGRDRGELIDFGMGDPPTPTGTPPPPPAQPAGSDHESSQGERPPSAGLAWGVGAPAEQQQLANEPASMTAADARADVLERLRAEIRERDALIVELRRSLHSAGEIGSEPAGARSGCGWSNDGTRTQDALPRGSTASASPSASPLRAACASSSALASAGPHAAAPVGSHEDDGMLEQLSSLREPLPTPPPWLLVKRASMVATTAEELRQLQALSAQVHADKESIEEHALMLRGRLEEVHADLLELGGTLQATRRTLAAKSEQLSGAERRADAAERMAALYLHGWLTRLAREQAASAAATEERPGSECTEPRSAGGGSHPSSQQASPKLVERALWLTSQSQGPFPSDLEGDAQLTHTVVRPDTISN